MHRRVTKIMALCIAGSLIVSQAEAQFSFFDKKDTTVSAEKKVEVTADSLEYVRGEDKIIGKGNVVVVHGTDQLFADYAEVYSAEKKAVARGHVMLVQGDVKLIGDTVEYDFESHQGVFDAGKFTANPFFGHAEDIEQVSENKAQLTNAFITTCDRAHTPHAGLSAKKVTLYFDDKLLAQNCFFHVLGKKVFWWPFIGIPLNGSAPFEIKPGYSDKMGAYALMSKGFSVTKNIGGEVHYDYRSRRGHATGLDLNYDFGPVLGNGFMRSYYASDDRAPDHKAADPESVRIEDDRYRFRWRHRADIDPYTRVVAEYNNMHDKYVLKDFFEKEHRAEADPQTYLEFVRNTERYGFLLNMEKRVNHFVDTTERLPEVRFNWNNQELGDTNIYYRNEASVINFNKKTANSGDDDDVVRAGVFNEISYPTKVEMIHVRPYLNARQDFYSKNQYGKENITRNVVGGGIDTSTRYFRVFNVAGKPLGCEINQLRHIIEPSISYEYVREASVDKDTLFQMDEIDEYDDFDELRFGWRNKLQTKRMINGELKRVDLFSTSHIANYEFHRETDGGSLWLDFENEIEFRPYTWLTMYHKNIWNFRTSQFKEAQFDIEVEPTDDWHVYVSHKFLNDRPEHFEEPSCLVTLDSEYTINELWKIGGYIRHEFDTSTTEEWELRFIRDLHCWLLKFGLNQRNNEGEDSEWEVFFELMIKAFPEYNMKSGSRASFTRARFGNLLSGGAGSTTASSTT